MRASGPLGQAGGTLVLVALKLLVAALAVDAIPQLLKKRFGGHIGRPVCHKTLGVLPGRGTITGIATGRLLGSARRTGSLYWPGNPLAAMHEAYAWL